MEILIVGGLLVALMVYVSTRIKKSAAQAYEREVVETEDFSLVKPEGFIIPVKENSDFAFEARSKDYGDDETHNISRAKIELNVLSNSDFKVVCRDALQSVGRITSEEVLTDDSRKQNTCLVKSEKTENEIPFYVFRKIIESCGRQKIYDLKISVLQDYREQYDNKINETINSFQVK